MKLGASGDGQVVRKFRVYPRPDFVTDVSSATLLQPCGAGNVTIQGDFVLSVWEADLTLTSDGKTEELRTGSLPASDASSADARPYAAHDQEIYVFAHNATMRLSSLSGLAYVGQPGIQAAGQVDLEGASGRLTVAGVAAVVSGAKVQMAGSAIAVRADGEAPSHPLSILVAGDVGSVAVDGQPLAAASTTLLGQPTYWIWVLLAAGGALVLWRARPLLVFYGMTLRGQSTGSTEPHATKERVGAGWWVMASRAYKRGRLARASRLAEKGRRAFPRSLDLEFLKGMVALNKMDGQTAFGVFSGLHGKVPSGAERCRMACLCAEAALVDGREEMALDWLRRAASDHFPTFRAELADARFDDLAGYGWFASMRRVSAPLAPDPAFG